MSSISFNNKFENIFAGITESEGKDEWNYRLFLLSNEQERVKVTNFLKTFPLQGNTIIGVSGPEILDKASQLVEFTKNGEKTLTHIFAIDLGIRTAKFWEAMKTIISTSKTRQEAQAAIIDNVVNNAGLYYSGGPCTTYQAQLQHAFYNTSLLKEHIRAGHSWLSSDAQFNRIKRMNIIFKRLDLFNPQAIGQLRKIIEQKGNNIKVGYLYISNVSEYANKVTYPYFLQSVSLLSQHDTFIIYTRYRDCETCEPLVQYTSRIKSSPGEPITKRHITDMFLEELKPKHDSHFKCVHIDRPARIIANPTPTTSTPNKKINFVEVDLSLYQDKLIIKLPLKLFMQIVTAKTGLNTNVI